MSFLLRGMLSAAIGLLVAASPRLASAACEGGTGDVNITVTVVDGSWVNPLWTWDVTTSASGHAGGTAYGNFGVTKTICLPGSTSGVTWNLKLTGGGFYNPLDPQTGSKEYLTTVTCQGATTASCTPNTVDLTVGANMGNFSGTVIRMPEGTPVGGATVYAKFGANPIYSRSVGTNVEGRFNFNSGGHENPWGVAVFGGYGVGFATYELSTSLNPTDLKTATTSSSQDTPVDFEISAPDVEKPIRCEPGDVCCDVKRPINVVSGNMYLDHSDAQIPGISAGGLAFERSYNSFNRGAGQYGVFGPGWSASYERRLTSMTTTGALALRRANGAPMYFFQDSPGASTYHATRPVTDTSTILRSGNTYTLRFRAGGYETYEMTGGVGRLTGIADVVGNLVVLAYDAGGRLSSVTDPSGRALTFAYEGATSRIATLSGPAGVIATYTYDDGGRLSSVVYADGDANGQPDGGYTFEYESPSGPLAVVRDLANVVLDKHTYYPDGRAKTSELEDGVEKYTLVYLADRTKVTDALGNETEYLWAPIYGQKRIRRITGICASCGGGAEVKEWTYDRKGRITRETHGAGTLTTYTYDEVTGDRLSVSRVLNADTRFTTTYTYYPDGRVQTQTNPDGGQLSYTYVAAGPATITERVTATLSRMTQFQYWPTGKLKSITDPRLKTTQFAYYASGDMLWAMDPLNHSVTYTYDLLGQRQTVTDALGHSARTVYDAVGRITGVTAHDGTKTAFEYDLGGRRTSITDPLGGTVRHVYDKYGRLEKTVDALQGATTYGYNLKSELTSLKDASGNATSFEYDGHARIKRVIHPRLGVETNTHDEAGRLATRVDRRGVETRYVYDKVSRLTEKVYTGGAPAVSDPPVRYTYDSMDRLLTAENGVDTLTWAYDLAGQMRTETSAKNASVIEYQYDDGGNRLQQKLNGELFVSYAYDDVNRLITIARGTNEFTFGYDATNRRVTMRYPNDVNTTYRYDDLDRLLSITAAKAGTVVSSSTYVYDAAGNRIHKAHPEYTETYGYDPLYRLTQVDRSGIAKRQRYVYDSVGNRVSEQTDNGVATYSYNTENELLSKEGGGRLRWRGSLSEPGNVSFTSATVNGEPARMLQGAIFEADIPVTAGSNTVSLVARDNAGNTTTKTYQVNVSGANATYTYDANGNLATKTQGSAIWTYKWTAENQLERVLRDGHEIARFAYDPLRRRVEQVGGGTTLSLFSGQNVVRQRGAVNVGYVYGLRTDELLGIEDIDGALNYQHADGLGSILIRTDGSGEVVRSERYDVWGTPETAPTSSSHAFTAREWDGGVGLSYNRARYYDPGIGRFISPDPIEFEGGINFYSYVGNNPVRFYDPFGLQTAVPGSETPRYNCMAWGLGITTTWVQACSRTPGSPNSVPPKFGCTPISCDATVPCGRSKVVIFEDESDASNWHVMRKDCGSSWTSKNGAGPLYKGIPDPPMVFYNEHYKPKGAFDIKCWDCPLGGLGRRPKLCW